MIWRDDHTSKSEQILRMHVEALKGPNEVNAFHRLLEYESDLSEFLGKCYHQETDVEIKARLVEVLWQRGRDAGTLDLLAAAVKEETPVIWKAAVDGLVSIGDYKALQILRRMKLESHADPTKLEWILEAIEQVEEQGRKDE